jgi:hypothetical protein
MRCEGEVRGEEASGEGSTGCNEATSASDGNMVRRPVQIPLRLKQAVKVFGGEPIRNDQERGRDCIQVQRR